MAALPRAERKLLLVIIIFSLFCTPVTCKKNKTPWLERILQDMLKTYYRFAKMEGPPETMNAKEFREYLKEDLPVFLEGKDPDIVENTLVSMDDDRDGELNYKEFFRFQTQYMVAKYNANEHLSA